MTVAITLAMLWAIGVVYQFARYYHGRTLQAIGFARVFEALCMAAVPAVCAYAARYLP